MNIDDRLRAASQALKESSVAQVDAASRLREIVQRTGQPVAHGRAAVLLDEPQESPRSLAPSLPPSGKVSAAAAGRNAAAPSTSHGTDEGTCSTFRSQPPSGNAVGRLLGSIWRYMGLIVAVVLLGALLGYGWAARQPRLYEGVARVFLAGSGRTALPGYLDNEAALMSSSQVLERAVKLSGNRISAETLRQRLEVEIASDADMLTIRVVDSTAKGAAQLANTVTLAYQEAVAKQFLEAVRSRPSRLRTRLTDIDAELARRPNDPVLRARRDAVEQQLLFQWHGELDRRRGLVKRAAVPGQPISPRPRRTVAIGMLVGLLASAVLVWWRTRRQGPEMPRPN